MNKYYLDASELYDHINLVLFALEELAIRKVIQIYVTEEHLRGSPDKQERENARQFFYAVFDLTVLLKEMLEHLLLFKPDSKLINDKLSFSKWKKKAKINGIKKDISTIEQIILDNEWGLALQLYDPYTHFYDNEYVEKCAEEWIIKNTHYGDSDNVNSQNIY